MPRGTDDATELQPPGGENSPTPAPDSRRVPAMGTRPSASLTTTNSSQKSLANKPEWHGDPGAPWHRKHRPRQQSQRLPSRSSQRRHGVHGRAAQSGTSPPARAVGPTALLRNWANRHTAASKPQPHLHSEQAQRPPCLNDLTSSTAVWDPGSGLPSSPLGKCPRPNPSPVRCTGRSTRRPGVPGAPSGCPEEMPPATPDSRRMPCPAGRRRCRAAPQACPTERPLESAPPRARSTVGDHNRHDGRALQRSQAMPGLLVLLTPGTRSWQHCR